MGVAVPSVVADTVDTAAASAPREAPVALPLASALVEYANARGIVVWSGRGRGIPQEGSTRSYKAQQLGEADPFIRLPVSALGASKGQVVTVCFQSGVIEVRAGA